MIIPSPARLETVQDRSSRPHAHADLCADIPELVMYLLSISLVRCARAYASNRLVSAFRVDAVPVLRRNLLKQVYKGMCKVVSVES